MRRRLLINGIVIIIAVLAAVAGCAPVGTIGGGKDYDSMWTVPYRVVYDINDLFVRSKDLSVFASYHGTIQSIPVKKVSISIIEDPDWYDDEIPIPTDSNYPLLETGRKEIVIRYGKLETRYSIEVRDPFGLEGNSNNNSGSGIIIEWENP